MRAFALTYHGETEGIHHIAEVHAIVSDPFEHDGFEDGGAEIGLRLKELGESCHICGHVGSPAFAHRFGLIFLGSLEEEACMVPEVAHKVDTALHHAYGAGDIIVAESRGVNAMGLKHGTEELSELGVVGCLQIGVVKPLAFFESELGAAA